MIKMPPCDLPLVPMVPLAAEIVQGFLVSIGKNGTNSTIGRFTDFTIGRTPNVANIGSVLGLCIKPVTEPNRTEPTEITEHIRPNLRKLSNIRGTGPIAIKIFRYRELTALPVKMTKILKFKHLFHYNIQRILCNVTAKLMKDNKGLLFVYLFVCFINIEIEIL